MFQNNTTICAISTPPGLGGIAVARISGPDAIAITQKVWHGKNLTQCQSHTAHLGTIVDPDTGDTLDQAVATLFRAPNSFTGEDTVELSVHGSLWVQQEVVNLLIRQGAEAAQAGEFTHRAFANRRIDLAQAEGIADVIASTSRASNRLAVGQMQGRLSNKLNNLRQQMLNIAALLELELDFSEEHVEFADRQQLHRLAVEAHSTVEELSRSFSTGDAIKRGVPIAIVGKPNVGKSSLLNCLIDDERAIVSDIPGTTRDTIEATATIGTNTCRFIDTAGLRDTSDTIENLGIDRAWQKIRHARIILWLITPSDVCEQCPTSEHRLTLSEEQQTFLKHLTTEAPEAKILLIINKIDLCPTPNVNFCSGAIQSTEHNSNHTRLSSYTCADNHSNLSIATFSALHPERFLPSLKQAISTLITADISDDPDAVIITNARHYQALLHTSDALHRVIDALTPGIPFPLPADLIAQDLREAIHHLSTITGTISTPDILSTIFSRFCIGK